MCLYLEERHTIKLVDETVRKWMRAFHEECEIAPELNDTKELYDENQKLRRELEEKNKEIAYLKKSAAFFAKEID